MVKLISESRKNKESVIDGELISADQNGIIEVNEKMADILLSPKYSFMGWQPFEEGEEIKKVEVSEPLEIEKGEPIKIPEPVDPKTPAEIIEEEEKSIEDIINGAEKFDELKEIAKTLELPKEEWENYKRADYFKKYLLKAISEDEETEE